MENNKIYCHICKKDSDYDLHKAFVRYHIKGIHNSNPQDYYDIYLKKDGEGLCENCGKTTPFRELRTGYRRYCCVRCSQLDPKTKEKKEKTLLEKTGYKNPMLNPKSLQKREKTNLKKYGKKSYFQTEEFQEKYIKSRDDEFYKKKNEKMVETCREKYGVDYYFQRPEFIQDLKDRNEEIREKFKKTCMARYGVENVSQDKLIWEKIKSTCNERFGVDRPMQHPEIANKLTKIWAERTPEYIKEMRDRSIQTLRDKRRIVIQNEELKEGYTFIDFIDKEVGNNKYLLYKIQCPKKHEFDIKLDKYFRRFRGDIELCTECNPCGSIVEKEFSDFIESVYKGKLIRNCYDLLCPLELDVYLPDESVVFEFNGIFWHSERWKEKWYHKAKTRECKNKNLRLIYMWEDTWRNRRKIAESFIKGVLGGNYKINAEDCDVKEIDEETANLFLNKNDIVETTKVNFSIGLYYNGILVYVMGFGIKNGRYRLLRMSPKINSEIVGGHKKCFEYVLDKYNTGKVVAYLRRDYFDGKELEEIGFKFVREGRINYWYVKGQERIEDDDGTILIEDSMYKVWGAGTDIYEYLR